MRNFIPFLKRPPLVPVIRLQGSIGTGRGSLSDAALAGLIDKAFKMKPAAVALANAEGLPAHAASVAARLER